ncbi:universal stress protein [Streptomyces silvisoli]|uniref:Universal stress protein n=1 Tax=Streptomyces silvisoli TaxID=3034235 RepID=A0ABT5ZUV3_9ACTN|nr:universal stress protein [Streptomyces silvisoli]MDF3293608.1 universal stress protein [Streptomyces silvisoli]
MSKSHGETARIVVGVDGSTSSKEALRWAVRQAELTHGIVEAVIAWDIPLAYASFGWLPPDAKALDLEGIAEQILADAIKEAVGPEPPVEIRTTVEHGNPSNVLLRAADGASLLVVGSRGHGGFAEALLGSVGQHCTQHAPCPVVIVRGRVG